MRPIEKNSLDIHIHNERWNLYTGLTCDVACRCVPWRIRENDPIISLAHKSLIAAGLRPDSVHKWRYERLGTGTSGGLLLNQYHIPTFGFGPGDDNATHTPIDSIELDQLTKAVFGGAVLVRSLTNAPSAYWRMGGSIQEVPR
jgi:hypothetical protein